MSNGSMPSSTVLISSFGSQTRFLLKSVATISQFTSATWSYSVEKKCFAVLDCRFKRQNFLPTLTPDLRKLIYPISWLQEIETNKLIGKYRNGESLKTEVTLHR